MLINSKGNEQSIDNNCKYDALHNEVKEHATRSVMRASCREVLEPGKPHNNFFKLGERATLKA